MKKLIFWTADWCGPCQSLKKNKVLEKVALHFGATLEIRDVDEKKWEAEADRLNILTLPTVELMEVIDLRPGGKTFRAVQSEKIIGRVLGSASLAQYVKKLGAGKLETESIEVEE